MTSKHATTEIYPHSKDLFLFWILFKSQIQARQLSFPQSLALFLSNLGPAEWLLQRREVRRRVRPSTKWWPENTAFTCSSTEWASRSLSLGHTMKSGNLPWRRWGLQMWTWIPSTTKPTGTQESGMFHIIFMYTCLENLMGMRNHQTNSTCW